MILLLIAIVCTVAAVRVFFTRQARCAETRHLFARRAPIAGASGKNTFVCAAMYEGMPLADKVIVAVWFFASIAVLRSLLMDAHERRRKRLLPPDEDYAGG